jgi:hypothetical protein
MTHMRFVGETPMAPCILATALALLFATTAAAQTHLEIPAYMKKPASGKIPLQPTRTLADLPSLTPPANERDQYGGLLAHTENASGFFRTQQIAGRWWLIDPDGHPFLNAGLVGVSTQHGPTFKQAFDKKFGTADKWRDDIRTLLSANFFTATGAWSNDDLLQSATPRIPYTPLVPFMGGYGKKRGGTYQQPGHLGYPGDCIFVFDPGFETFADDLAQTLAARKDDPWLIGYESDNEMPFPPSLLNKYRALPSGDPGRIAADAWFAERHPHSTEPPTKDDLEAFRGFVADRYYGIVARAIKKVDPHHLYLGSRCNSTERTCLPFMQNAGKHVDVMTVNVYHLWSPGGDIRAWSAACQKPMFVTEFYAKGIDSGMPNLTGAGWTVPTQADRGAFYQNFTLGLLESKGCVGWTWFKYADNDPLDTASDPSNRDSNKGVVNDKYEPYVPLLHAMGELNQRIYALADYFDKAHATR